MRGLFAGGNWFFGLVLRLGTYERRAGPRRGAALSVESPSKSWSSPTAAGGLPPTLIRAVRLRQKAAGTVLASRWSCSTSPARGGTIGATQGSRPRASPDGHSLLCPASPPRMAGRSTGSPGVRNIRFDDFEPIASDRDRAGGADSPSKKREGPIPCRRLLGRA